jgi:hypothetical protein
MCWLFVLGKKTRREFLFGVHVFLYFSGREKEDLYEGKDPDESERVYPNQLNQSPNHQAVLLNRAQCRHFRIIKKKSIFSATPVAGGNSYLLSL